MATFVVTDPQSGLKLRLTGDSPPTEQELEAIFAAQIGQQVAGEQSGAVNSGSIPSVSGDGSGELLDRQQEQGLTALGVAEPAATIASTIVAEPIAGVAGIASEAGRRAPIPTPIAGLGGLVKAGLEAFDVELPSGVEAIESVREALTFQPRTEAGQAGLEAVGETLEPIGEALTSAESFLGDAVLEATDSPALAAAASTLPTAALEIIGLKGGGRLGRATKRVGPSAKEVSTAIVESAPEVRTLKNASRAIYKELDEAGATVRPQAINKLVSEITQETKKAGLDARVTPKSAGALQVIQESAGRPHPITEIDTLRRVAQNAADSIEAAEKNLGRIMIEKIDDFLDNPPSGAISKGSLSSEQIGKRYSAARNLWGRARRSELIQNAIREGKDAASGIENGIRIELRKLIKNKRTKKFFPKAEADAIRDVVQGDFAQNFSKMIGRMGFGEGASTSVLGTLGGIAGGGAAFGTPGAVAVPAAGVAARQIAKRLTKGRAQFVDSIVRAGNDGEAIAKAYLSLPKEARKTLDLADLLSGQGVVNVQNLKGASNRLVREAAEIAEGRKVIGEAAGALGAGARIPEEENAP